MFLDRERRRFPSIHRVAGRALAMIGPACELPGMRIGLVTVHTPLEGEGFLEISASVTLRAINAGVLSLQRKLCLRVVEAFIHRVERNLLPSPGAMAGLAALRKTSMMRILMAIRTLVEWDSRVSRLGLRARRMTFRARNLSMQSRQRIARPRMVELADANRLPILEVVALLTTGPKPTAVRVLMAGRTGGRYTQVSLSQIFDFDRSAPGRADLPRLMAAVACQPLMF